MLDERMKVRRVKGERRLYNSPILPGFTTINFPVAS